MIGTLGGATFQASRDRVFTFRDFSRNGSARVEEHNVIGQKPVLEFVGPGLEQITLNVRLDRFLGVDPERELEKMRQSRDTGEELPLTIGGKYQGKWLLTTLDETHRRHDGSGRVIVAEVALTLREVADNGRA